MPFLKFSPEHILYLDKITKQKDELELLDERRTKKKHVIAQNIFFSIVKKVGH